MSGKTLTRGLFEVRSAAIQGCRAENMPIVLAAHCKADSWSFDVATMLEGGTVGA